MYHATLFTASTVLYSIYLASWYRMVEVNQTCAVGDPQSLLSPGSSDPAAGVRDATDMAEAANTTAEARTRTASEERAQGPVTRTRTSSEKQGEVPELEGPYLPGYGVTRAGASRTTGPGSKGPLRKVKKGPESKKKNAGKMCENKENAITNMLLREDIQQNNQRVG